MGLPPPDGFVPGEMGTCGLHTKYKGDKYCIKPPPPDKAFRFTSGRSNYDNPEPQWIMHPGNEEWRTSRPRPETQ